MSRRFRGKTPRSFWLLLTLAGVFAAGARPLAAIVRGWEAPPGIESLEWVEVTREDFDTTLFGRRRFATGEADPNHL